MPKKVRELKQTVTQSGFVLQKKRGKGSHTFWIHPLLPFMPLTIPGKDGDDAPRYLEKQVQEALQALQKIQEDN
jgi:predicted RNA binding protein YcfA (HicA-like mRNA interferase family)